MIAVKVLPPRSILRPPQVSAASHSRFRFSLRSTCTAWRVFNAGLHCDNLSVQARSWY